MLSRVQANTIDDNYLKEKRFFTTYRELDEIWLLTQ